MLLAVVFLIYGPEVGHGFVQDDFAWILHARSSGVLDALDRAFTTSLGFFRPIVTLSFALDEWMFGLEPFGYGLTNLLLAIACMFAVEHLGRRIGLAPRFALLAAGVWVFNFHGINMAVLWLSGRSSLLSTLFGLIAASMLEARRPMLTTAFILLALLSKEDAVMLPLILFAWRVVHFKGETSPLPVWRSAAKETWPLFLVLIGYALLRSQSGAFTPVTAPDFYRFTMEPERLLRNFVEYLNRSGTTGALVLIAVFVVARAKPRLERIHATVAVKGALWWLGGFALTMWLPVRSSLYAVFPSVGVALIVALMAGSLVPTLPSARRRALLIAGLLLPLLFLPLYRARNVRWVSLADLTTATLAHARTMLPELPDRTVITLIDDRDVRANFINAFSSLTPEASQLFLERGIEVAVEPPPDASRPHVELKLSEVNP